MTHFFNWRIILVNSRQLEYRYWRRFLCWGPKVSFSNPKKFWIFEFDQIQVSFTEFENPKFWNFSEFSLSILIFKGGVQNADTTKSSRSFCGGDGETVECPVDIDDYMEPPCVFPRHDDG